MKNKTAVITGASSGIGAACARYLAGRGWRVLLVARRVDELEKIAHEIGGISIVADVTTIQESDFPDDFRCDLLVNSAGGALGLDSVAHSSESDWEDMFKVNTIGTLRVIKILLPKIIESQGSIINVTSTAAVEGYPGGGGYCASKSAARALTQSLRMEMRGVPVRITEVLPGMVHTPEFSLNRFAGDRERAESVYADVDRPLMAEDIAQTVGFLSELPPHVNVDEIIIRPVAQRSQHDVFRGDIGWNSPVTEPSPRWI